MATKTIQGQDKITALYCRLSVDDNKDEVRKSRKKSDDESNSITNQVVICKGWIFPSNTYDCGSFVVNRKAVVGKEQKNLIIADKFNTERSYCL